jgi:hypothetical protein
MRRGFVSVGDRNYYVYEDGRVVEELTRWRWIRFGLYKNSDYVSWPYEVLVTDSRLQDRVRLALLRLQHLGRTTFPAQKRLMPGPRVARNPVSDVRRRRFITPDGAEWEYSTEFNGRWVLFEQVGGSRRVSGAIEPKDDPTQEELIETLKDLWRRKNPDRPSPGGRARSAGPVILTLRSVAPYAFVDPDLSTSARGTDSSRQPS